MNTIKNISKAGWFKWLKRVALWVTPVIILYCIFKRIDFVEFKISLAQTNPWLASLGLAVAPFLILTGAARWHYMLSIFNPSNIPYCFILKNYWIGSSLGFFSPGAIGFDAYRVIISSPRFGSHTFNIIIILIEKYIALITCMFLIVTIYPFVSTNITSDIKKIFYLAYFVLFCLIILIFVISFGSRNSIVQIIFKKIEQYFSKSLGKLLAKLNLNKKTEIINVPFKDIIASLQNTNFIKVILFSFGIQLISAVKSRIFFWSLGYEIPFIVNLLIVPTLYFIFLLPISIGSLGIREGVYIILYGLFGVPMETALLVSFFNLTGILLNNLIGGMVMLFTGTHSGGSKKTFQRG